MSDYPQKVLFLCSQNKRRSLTAEHIFQEFSGIEVKSAGTESNARSKVTPGLLGWADMIFGMEKKHIRRLQEKYADCLIGKKVVCLYIEDDYEYMAEELIDLLETKVGDYIKK